MHQNGKGSKPRPKSVSSKQFEENWEKVFGKKKDLTDKEREEALNELTRLTQEFGGYNIELSTSEKEETEDDDE